MPLFQIAKGHAQQIRKTAFPSEKALQELFEKNLESLLSVRFVASEFGTGEKHGGRIDTLGLDEKIVRPSSSSNGAMTRPLSTKGCSISIG